MNDNIKNKLFVLGAVVGYGILFLLMYHRLALSVELTDEIGYQAIAYRIVAGNIPFSEALDGHYGGNLFAVPVLTMFKYINGTYDGSVLFLRKAYFLFTVLISVLIALCMRKRIGFQYGLLASIPLVFAVPFSLPFFSYNTNSIWLACLGYFIVLADDMKNSRLNKWFVILAGIVHALAAFCYPTLTILCAINVILLFCYYRLNYDNATSLCGAGYYFGSGILTALLITGIVTSWSGGIQPVIKGIEMMFQNPYFSLGVTREKTSILLSVIQYLRWQPFLVNIPFFLAMIYFIRRKTEKDNLYLLFVMIIGTIFNCFLIFRSEIYAALNFYTYLLLTCCIVTIFLVDKKQQAQNFLLMVIPSIVMVVLVTKTADNGTSPMLYKLYVMLPAVIGSIYSLVSLIKEREKKDTLNKSKYKVVVLFISLSIASTFLVSYYNYVYRDGVVSELNTKVETGLYKGLYTTKDRKDGLEILEKELRENTDKTKTLLVPSWFPAPYIMTGMKPHTPAIAQPMLEAYGFRGAKVITDYFNMMNQKADTVIFVFDRDIDYGKNKYDFDNPEFEFNQYLEEYYNLKFKSKDGEKFMVYIFDVKE